MTRGAALAAGALAPIEMPIAGTARRTQRRKLRGAILVGALGVVGGLAARAAAAPHATIVAGAGAVADFDVTSADGCTHTFGELAVVQATPGAELANGLYVTGAQEDLCGGGFGNGFAGFAPVSAVIVPLVWARVATTIVADSYSGGAPVTLELDLRWTGRGPVTRSGGVVRDPGLVDFSFARTRAATTAGTLDVDGDAAAVTSASLVAEVHGTVTY